MEELIPKLKLILKFVIALEKEQSDPYPEMLDYGNISILSLKWSSLSLEINTYKKEWKLKSI